MSSAEEPVFCPANRRKVSLQWNPETNLKLPTFLCGSELTEIFQGEGDLVVQDGPVPGAQLHRVGRPDRGVVLVEEALVGSLRAVVGTFVPVVL